MHIPKFLIVILISTTLLTCGGNSTKKTPNFSIETNANNNTFKLGEMLELQLKNPKDKVISSIQAPDNTQNLN